MTDLDLREELPKGVLMLDNPSFDKSIIGVSTDNRVVYNYDSMIEELASDSKITIEEARDFIDYNTVRSLPYHSNGPIIVNILDSY